MDRSLLCVALLVLLWPSSSAFSIQNTRKPLHGTIIASPGPRISTGLTSLPGRSRRWSLISETTRSTVAQCTTQETLDAQDTSDRHCDGEPARKHQRQAGKQIVVSTSLDMPFSAHEAFDAFSDLPRQSTFSPWLHSVEYLTPPEDGADRIGENLGETKWTMKFMGARFSWNSIATRLERPHLIEWESTSGLKNFGRVDFRSLEDGKTNMTMTMTFVAPRVVASLFRRSSKMAAFVQNKMLHTTLENFRDAIKSVDSAKM